MLFNSFAFAVFLPIVFIIYWLIPHKLRWVLLLAASYYFYMSWNAKYIFLILFTTFISYAAALFIERSESRKEKKLILAGTAAACLGVLFFFKYFNFVSESLTAVLGLFSIRMDPFVLNLLLPVGISFYTFQTLSYVIDVYRGDVKAERHFGYYATFISFFPQLVAGPIERTNNLLPQIKAEHKFDYDKASYGLKLMAWGFFKKIVIADTISQYVSLVYDSPHDYAGFSFVLATLMFSVQIYCDFSGYSDIAIGTSKLFGIDLMTNFRSPYFSQSLKEFWGRWHISLSSWFRDYVYVPLGGSRAGRSRRIFNIMVMFLASGLWHGAEWKFVIWGGVLGAGRIIEDLAVPKEKLKKKSRGIDLGIRIIIVYLFITCTYLFFVSNSLSDAVYVMTHVIDGVLRPVAYVREGFSAIGLKKAETLKILVLVMILAVYDWFSMKADVINEISKKSVWVRWPVYTVLVLVVIFLSQKGAAAEFIYFQF